MKTHRNPLHGGLLVLATGLLLATANTARAGASASPVGPVWDIVISGRADGVAYFSFLPNGELCGIEILVPRSSGGTEGPTEKRYSGTEPGRVPGEISATNSISPTNVLYGAYLNLKGWWTYDTSGRIVGGFPEIASRAKPKTTEVVITNDFGFVVTNQVTGTIEEAVTNNVSFIGKVSSSGRLSMTGHSGIGKLNYRGVALTAVPDFSGPFLGDTRRSGQQFYEVMRLSPNYTDGYCALPYYWVCGQGPAYYFSGVALASTQKRIAIATARLNTDETIARVVGGSANFTRKTASLSGGEDPQLRVKLKLSPLLYGAPPPLPCDPDEGD